jgi:hypothetical protein
MHQKHQDAGEHHERRVELPFKIKDSFDFEINKTS